MTLRELLKDKKLPVKVTYDSWDKTQYFEIMAANEDYAIGFLDNKNPEYFGTNNDRWTLYTEPKKKKKLYAWFFKKHLNTERCAAPLFTPSEHWHDYREKDLYVRAPWLDGEVEVEE